MLAPRPDILLLDEPTNHLDLPAIEWLEGELKAMRAALVLISHDRRFLENLSRAVVWLDRGQTRRLEQGFAAFENWRDTVLEQEEIERHKRDRKIADELDWLAHGRSARRKRNQGRLARLSGLRQGRREELKQLGTVKMEAAEGGSLRHQGDRRQGRGQKLRRQAGDPRFHLAHPSRRPHRHCRSQWRGQDHLAQAADRRARTPDAGNVKLGTGLEMARAGPEPRQRCIPKTTLANALTGGGGDTVFVGGKPRHVMSYMQDFLFTPAQARTPVKVLSGGERARLLLARLFATAVQFPGAGRAHQ